MNRSLKKKVAKKKRKEEKIVSVVTNALLDFQVTLLSAKPCLILTLSVVAPIFFSAFSHTREAAEQNLRKERDADQANAE